jgi:hypothetical protein
LLDPPANYPATTLFHSNDHQPGTKKFELQPKLLRVATQLVR